MTPREDIGWEIWVSEGCGGIRKGKEVEDVRKGQHKEAKKAGKCDRSMVGLRLRGFPTCIFDQRCKEYI